MPHIQLYKKGFYEPGGMSFLLFLLQRIDIDIKTAC